MLVSEKEILKIAAQLQLKSSSAFSRMYTAYAAALKGTIQRVVKCVPTAEDILQNVKIKIWKQSDKYEKGKGVLFTWIITVAWHETIDYVRINQKYYVIANTADPDSTIADPCSTDRLINRMDMRKLIRMLPPNERAILELYISGFSYHEINQILHLPESTAKTRMRTAYRKLRLALPN